MRGAVQKTIVMVIRWFVTPYMRYERVIWQPFQLLFPFMLSFPATAAGNDDPFICNALSHKTT